MTNKNFTDHQILIYGILTLLYIIYLNIDSGYIIALSAILIYIKYWHKNIYSINSNKEECKSITDIQEDKEKCLKCKSVELYNDKPVLIDSKETKKVETEYSEPYYDRFNHNPMLSRYDTAEVRGYYRWTEIIDTYNIIHHCKDCNHSWSEIIHTNKKSNQTYTSA